MYTNISICNCIPITYSYFYILYIYNTLVRIYAGFNIYFFPKENHYALWELCVCQWSSKNVFSVCVSLTIWCLQTKYEARSGWWLELPNKGHLWSTSLSCRMHHSGCQPSLGVSLYSVILLYFCSFLIASEAFTTKVLLGSSSFDFDPPDLSHFLNQYDYFRGVPGRNGQNKTLNWYKLKSFRIGLEFWLRSKKRICPGF